MKQIDLTFTESLLTPYDITVDDLAIANGYTPQVANESYVAEIREDNPDYVPPVYKMDETGMHIIENGEAVIITPAVGEPEIVTPAVGTPFIDNPETSTEFISRKLPEVGMTTMIENVMRPKIQQAEKDLAELKKQPALIAAQLVSRITKTVTE